MKITLQQLNTIFPVGARAGRNVKFLDPLNQLFESHDINTVNRIAGFLSQIGVESAEFKYVRELGNTSYFDKYEPRTPLGIKLGNTQKGDGAKYKGRGLIQVTGRYNYGVCGKYLGVDILNNPSLLEEPLYAVLSAGWYWESRNINDACDKDDITRITRLVNGGTNHLKERTEYYNQAKKVLASA